MTQELRERVAFEFRSMAASETHNRVPYTWEQIADAAIALVLEEAAKECDEGAVRCQELGLYSHRDAHMDDAAAIRALKEGK